MNALKNADSRLVIAGLGTLAALGSFVVGAVFFAIFLGLGMNEDLAWGLSVLMWIAVVAVGVLGVVHFYNSIKNRFEQVTVIRTVAAPPTPPEMPTVEAEDHPFLDRPTLPVAPSTNYRSMLMEGDKKDDQLG